LFPRIETLRRHPERERQHECQQSQRGSNHCADRRLFLATRLTMPVIAKPVAALDGCQDEHKHGEEHAPQREHVKDGRVLRHHGGSWMLSCFTDSFTSPYVFRVEVSGGPG
jgi:hypothetical protein